MEEFKTLKDKSRKELNSQLVLKPQNADYTKKSYNREA